MGQPPRALTNQVYEAVFLVPVRPLWSKPHQLCA